MSIKVFHWIFSYKDIMFQNDSCTTELLTENVNYILVYVHLLIKPCFILIKVNLFKTTEKQVMSS